MLKTFCQVKLKDISYKLFYLEDRYFPPTLYIQLLYFFSERHIFSSTEKWIDSINYLIKIELAISTLSATLQAGDLIDQVDRERGANINQSRGIQFIHAKRLTHHPNTRYTLLVMDSWPYSILHGLFQVGSTRGRGGGAQSARGLFLWNGLSYCNQTWYTN